MDFQFPFVITNIICNFYDFFTSVNSCSRLIIKSIFSSSATTSAAFSIKSKDNSFHCSFNMLMNSFERN